MGAQRPTVMLLGDISFVHDINSLHLMRLVRHPMVVVLLNNDGGGIFNMLPMGEAANRRTDYFVLPHGLNAKHAAVLFKCDYHAPSTPEAFKTVLEQALLEPSGTIIEVFTPAGQGADSIRQLVRQVQQL